MRICLDREICLKKRQTNYKIKEILILFGKIISEFIFLGGENENKSKS